MRYAAFAKWAIASMMVLLFVSASAFAGGNQITQSISMSGEGGHVSQNAANAAVVYGDNNYVNQEVSQNAQGEYITQSAANAAVVVGNGNTVGQGVYQDAAGNYISQSGANAIAVVGDDNYVSQDVTQRAYGNEIYQTGWNTGTITGDGNTLCQRTLARAWTKPTERTDPVQTMSNFAQIRGSYNTVGQDILGYAIVGSGNGPIDQSGSNVVETDDMNWNFFGQGISFVGESGPGSDIMQSAQNEVWVG